MKELMINETTEISCYPEYGFIFSVLPSLGDPWVVNNFIQIKLIPEWEYFIAYQGHERLLDECPYLKSDTAGIAGLDQADIDIVDYVNGMLRENICAFLYLDRFYISSLPEYSRAHYIHNTFVVGHDLENELIYLADNFHEGKYNIVECNFDELRNAFYQNRECTIRNDVLEGEYGNELIPYISDMIGKKGRAFVFADRMYIRSLNTPFPLAHNIEISGCDCDKEELTLVADYWGKITTVRCSFEEMKMAFRRDPKQDSDDRIVLLKREKKGAEDRIDPERIMEELKAYLNPKQETDMVNGYSCYYGMQSLKEVVRYLETKKMYRIRIFHFLYEHKILMEKRVEQLMERGIIARDDEFMNRFRELTRKYKGLRNKAVKISISPAIQRDENLPQVLQELIDEEKACLSELLERLTA